MVQIASVDWEAKRFYLHADTVAAGFDAWLAFAEVRQAQQINANSEQNYPLFIHRQGKVSKGGGKFTPRYVSFDPVWRAVPYDLASHELSILVEMVSDDQLSDRDMFDRSGVAVNVDIDPIYAQVEIIEVATGGASDVFSDLIEGSLTAAAVLRLILSATAGKGGVEVGGIVKYRDLADTKDRIVATTAAGKRSAVTLDGS